MEFPFSGNSSQAYGSIYVTAYIPPLPYYPFPWQRWTTVRDCLKGRSEMLLLGYLWETKLSSPGLRSCEATTDPCLHLCGAEWETFWAAHTSGSGRLMLSMVGPLHTHAHHIRSHHLESLLGKISLKFAPTRLDTKLLGLPWLLILGFSKPANPNTLQHELDTVSIQSRWKIMWASPQHTLP